MSSCGSDRKDLLVDAARTVPSCGAPRLCGPFCCVLQLARPRAKCFRAAPLACPPRVVPLMLARARRLKHRTMIVGSVATLAVAAVAMTAVTLFATSSVTLLSKTHTLVSAGAHVRGRTAAGTALPDAS